MTSPLCFHLAFPVKDLALTREFYVGLLGCREGRSAPAWVDFDFFGHQISAHLMPAACRSSHAHDLDGDSTHDPAGAEAHYPDAGEAHDVDGDNVPVRHFGLVLEWREWHLLAERLEKLHARFLIAPHIRFRGEVGEQATLFLLDPSGNALEFKAFQDPARIFAR